MAPSPGYLVRGSADLDFAIGNELIGRHRQVGRRRALANPTRGVVLRAVARAEEAVVIAFMGDRNAAEMGANADHDEPLVVALLDPGLVGLRIGKACDRHRAGLVDLLLGAVADVDRLAPPEHLDVLPFGNRRQIDFDRRAGRNRRGVRIHLGNERPERDHSTNRSSGSRCNKEEITACRMIRRRRCRHDSKPFLSCSRWNRPRQCIDRPGRLPASATLAAAERPLFPANRAEQAVQNRSIGTLAGRAQARYRLVSVQCTKSARSVDLFRYFMGTRRAVTHAGCAFPARHLAEYRDDSSSLCVPECGGPYYRTRWFSGVRPALPPGRHGLSRRGGHHASRLMVKIRAMAY